MMKRIGRVLSIEGKMRSICKIEAEELEPELDESAGMYTPPSRKDLMLDMRIREDAEGERRIIGSGLRAGALGLWAKVGLFARFCAAACCDFRAAKSLARKQRLEIEMSLPPEHLPNSPLCPKHPMHKSKGKGICMYHGRKRSVSLQSTDGGCSSGDSSHYFGLYGS